MADRRTSGSLWAKIQGKWYNTLGSRMFLEKRNADGIITGIYKTAVESKEGAALYNQLTGRVCGGNRFIFSVLWKGGFSVTLWSATFSEENGGQISANWQLCGNREEAEKLWNNTSVNQDVFTRTQPTTSSDEEKDTADDDGEFDVPCQINGSWRAPNGDTITLNYANGNLITGKFKVNGQSEQDIYGIANPHFSQTTLCLYIVADDGSCTQGWTGQCFNLNGKDKLITKWFNGSSDGTKFGTTVFERTHN